MQKSASEPTTRPNGAPIIMENGAILLSEDIVVDGDCCSILARVTTHIHSDHARGLSSSARRAGLLVATPLTHDLLEALGQRLPRQKRLDASYDTPLKINGTILRLLPANHVPGAAQVLIETEEGLRIGYTGDFKMPGTPVMTGLDVLVIDATYGKPEWRRPWQEEMEYLLPDLVLDRLAHGPVHIYAYNGKVEEVMLLLRRGGVAAPIVVPRRRARVLNVLRRHGLLPRDVLVEGSSEALEAMRSGWYVQFHHFREWRARRTTGTRMLLTGWEFSAPYREAGPRDIIVSFSDHADFEQLVKYASEARPRLLVVDAARGAEAAVVFAEYARRKLGLNAIALPSSLAAGREA